LTSSCSHSIALVVGTLCHWLGGSRVKVNSRSPASSRLGLRVFQDIKTKQCGRLDPLLC